MPTKFLEISCCVAILAGCTSNVPTKPAVVASVRVTSAATALPVDGSVQLTVAALAQNGEAIGGRAASWSTSSAGVATVSSNGLVTGIAPGAATITAIVDNVPGSLALTVTAPTAPASRWEASMVYNSTLQQVLLIAGSTIDGSGGAATTRFRGDVWAWNGSAWVLQALPGPTPRDGAIVGFDPATQRVVLHGGRDPQAVAGANPPLTDTWIANGAEWNKLTNTGPAPARHHAGGGWDLARSRLVMFGGGDPTITHRDTWEWDGTSWSLKATTTPSTLSAPSNAVFSTGRNALLMLVGTFASGPTEIWQWSGSAWSKVGDGPAGTMPMRIAATGPNELLIFDGATGNTYRWNGTATSQVSTSGPGVRATPAMAYDASRQRVVLFGGYRGTSTLSDTWLWNGSAWTQAGVAGIARAATSFNR